MSFSIKGISQFTIIPTGTINNTGEINRIDDFILINFPGGDLAKCYGDCDNLIYLNAPGSPGYLTDNVTLLDTNTIYMLSFVGFPHHGLVFKSEDGGSSWETLLDTTNMLLTDFIMFDTINGFVAKSFYVSLLTADDGQTWSAGSHPLVICETSLKINDSTAIIGVNEHVSITTDKGLSWQGDGFPQSHPRAFFAKNLDSIYAITYGVTGIFFAHTFDLPAQGWTKRTIPDFDPYGLFVKTKDEVYITGQCLSTGTARIMKTTDLGITWSFFDTGLDATLSDIEFLNDSIALIGGTGGLLLRWNSNSHFEMLDVPELTENSTFLTIYPNPTNHNQTLVLMINRPIEGSIRLTDLNGRLIQIVYSGKFEKGKNSYTVDLGDFATGLYLYEIVFSDGITHYQNTIKQ